MEAFRDGSSISLRGNLRKTGHGELNWVKYWTGKSDATPGERESGVSYQKALCAVGRGLIAYLTQCYCDLWLLTANTLSARGCEYVSQNREIRRKLVMHLIMVTLCCNLKLK